MVVGEEEIGVHPEPPGGTPEPPAPVGVPISRSTWSVKRTMFGDAVVVESRYISPIESGMRLDGLEVLFGVCRRKGRSARRRMVHVRRARSRIHREMQRSKSTARASII